MIHSERDLFSSVAFFAERPKQRIYVRWLPLFFSPWELDLVLFCGHRCTNHSREQYPQHTLSSVLHQLPPKTSSCLVHVCFTLSSLIFLLPLSFLSLKKSLLMMVAWKKDLTLDCCTIAWAVILPRRWGTSLGRTGGRPGGGQSSAVTPQRPETPSQYENEEMNKEMIQKKSAPSVKLSTLLITWKHRDAFCHSFLG